jgi:hypothetical protein
MASRVGGARRHSSGQTNTLRTFLPGTRELSRKSVPIPARSAPVGIKASLKVCPAIPTITVRAVTRGETRLVTQMKHLILSFRPATVAR